MFLFSTLRIIDTWSDLQSSVQLKYFHGQEVGRVFHKHNVARGEEEVGKDVETLGGSCRSNDIIPMCKDDERDNPMHSLMDSHVHWRLVFFGQKLCNGFTIPPVPYLWPILKQVVGISLILEGTPDTDVRGEPH